MATQVPAQGPAAKPTKEELEIKKLQLEIEEKALGKQFYKTPSFWFSVITAIAATVGIAGQYVLSQAKFDRAAAEAKLAELDLRQSQEKSEKAKDEAKAADAKARQAVKEREEVQGKLTKAQQEVERLETQKQQELDQGSARQAIKKHNGEVAEVRDGGIGAYFKATSLSTQDLQELKSHFEKLPDFRTLNLTRVELTNEGLSQLADLGGLVELRLDGNRAISDVGLTCLGSFGRLQILGLGQTGLKNAGLAHLKALSELRELYLYDTAVSDEGMVHLIGLSNLRVLSLTNTRVSEGGLEQLKSLTQLTDVYLDGSLVTASGLAKVNGMRRLKLMSLDGRQITPSSLPHLKDLPDLEILYLRGEYRRQLPQALQRPTRGSSD
jgi:hypothetical protein